MKIGDIIKELSLLSIGFHSEQVKLTNKYRFDELKDVRINVFKHCYIILDSTYILLLVRSTVLFEDDWWKKVVKLKLINKRMTQKERRKFIFGFDSFVISSYVIMLLFSIESAFRSIYQSVYLTEPPNKFHKVFGCLLEEFNLGEYKDLVKLASYIRNTLHNNGVHTLKDDIVSWKNLTIRFVKGSKIDLGDTWKILITITKDLLQMLKRLISSKVILEKRIIIDCSYGNLI